MQYCAMSILEDFFHEGKRDAEGGGREGKKMKKNKRKGIRKRKKE